MSVRAKFKVDSFHTTLQQQRVETPPTSTGGILLPVTDRYEYVEMRTINLFPVYSPDLDHENHKFWRSSPSGRIELGTVNPEAWKNFELGKEYYVDFTPA